MILECPVLAKKKPQIYSTWGISKVGIEVLVRFVETRSPKRVVVGISAYVIRTTRFPLWGPGSRVRASRPASARMCCTVHHTAELAAGGRGWGRG